MEKNAEAKARGKTRSVSADSLVEQGILYYRGDTVEQDYKKALNLFLRASRRGSRRAMYLIGLMYLEGKGVKKNFNMSVKWIAKCDLLGDIKPKRFPVPDLKNCSYPALVGMAEWIVKELSSKWQRSIWLLWLLSNDCINSMRWDIPDWIDQNPYYGRILRAWIDVNGGYEPWGEYEEIVLYCESRGIKDAELFSEWCRVNRPDWYEVLVNGAGHKKPKTGLECLQRRMDWSY